MFKDCVFAFGYFSIFCACRDRDLFYFILKRKKKLLLVAMLCDQFVNVKRGEATYRLVCPIFEFKTDGTFVVAFRFV